MDCSSPHGVTRAYETFFSSTGTHHDGRGHMITLEMFTRSLDMLGFDFTPDREADESISVCPVKEISTLRHALRNHYPNRNVHSVC